MEKEIHLPVSEKEVRKLKVSDIVYVSGTVHTMRDMGHRRAVEMIKRGEELPFNLKEGAIWHCGPIARKVGDTWEIVSAGPTSSSRFTELGSELVRKLNVRLTIGKGVMGKSMIEALKETGGVYLVATGGCAALYAKQIVKVENVHWLDLGMPEATWVLKVNKLGPLVVGIDSSGNTLESIVLEKVYKNVNAVYAKEKIDPSRSYVWWPKKIPGSTDFTK
ncbi:MAG: FumA C-terminus/TtdB family hydratase beta subunit [Candidatus Bathyarchaeia archaeon]